VARTEIRMRVDLPTTVWESAPRSTYRADANKRTAPAEDCH